MYVEAFNIHYKSESGNLVHVYNIMMHRLSFSSAELYSKKEHLVRHSRLGFRIRGPNAVINTQVLRYVPFR